MATVNDKVEAALVALVSAALTAAERTETVHAGRSQDARTEPCVVCAADGDGLEDPPMTGNVWLDALVQVRYPAVDDQEGTTLDSEADAKALTAIAHDAVHVDDLVAQMNAAGITGLTVFGVLFGAPQSGREEESGIWVDDLPLRIYCC